MIEEINGAAHGRPGHFLARLKKQKFVISMLLVVTTVDFSYFESLDSDSKPLKFLTEIDISM